MYFIRVSYQNKGVASIYLPCLCRINTAFSMDLDFTIRLNDLISSITYNNCVSEACSE